MKHIIYLLAITAVFAGALTGCEKADTETPDTRGQLAVNPQTCTIDFDLGNGVIVDEQYADMGDYISEPAEPAREGYAFAGWTIDIVGDNLWNFDQDQVYSSMILYAKWIAAPVVK